MFLAKRPELWSAPHRTVKRELVAAGLVSTTTYILDLRIKSLIEDAKKVNATA
jgi:hypothetical protein